MHWIWNSSLKQKNHLEFYFLIFNIIHNFDNCQNKDQTRKNVGLTYFKNKNKEIMLLWSKWPSVPLKFQKWICTTYNL